MANDIESTSSTSEQAPASVRSEWLKVGVIAAASVLAGGIAAAWWYRKTLTKLRQNPENTKNPHFGMDKGEGTLDDEG